MNTHLDFKPSIKPEEMESLDLLTKFLIKMI